MSKKDGGAGKEAKAARADELARQDRIRAGTDRINGIFDTQTGGDFLSRRRDAYMNYATPQLDDQYGKATRDLTFSLARNGNLDSSARGQQAGELQKRYDLNRQNIADQAVASATDAATSAEDARSSLISTLNSTGDAQQATNSALGRATALSRPAAFNPLSNMFADLTSAYNTQQQVANFKKYSGVATNFAPTTGAVVVSR